ncbi:hypothetical protein BH09BAC1_BH09BAC1_17100 [soil metagenome]
MVSGDEPSMKEVAKEMHGIHDVRVFFDRVADGSAPLTMTPSKCRPRKVVMPVLNLNGINGLLALNSF